MIYMIVACTPDYLIGTAKTINQIPWKNKEDLAHFKQTTLNQTILMGRKTFAAIGQPLPNRHTIVLTRNKPDATFDHVTFSDDLPKIIADYKNSGKDLYICGGKEIYEACLADVDTILLSRIPGKYQGEVYLSDLWLNDFQLVTKIPKNTFELEVYRRKTYV